MGKKIMFLNVSKKTGLPCANLKEYIGNGEWEHTVYGWDKDYGWFVVDQHIDLANGEKQSLIPKMKFKP